MTDRVTAPGEKTAFAVAVASFVAFVVCVAVTAGDLPERFPSHFDLHGNPNGWSDKGDYLIAMPLVVAATNAFVLILMPWLISRVPESAINMPRKNYWFATPERKALALGKLRVVLAGTGAYVNLLVLVLHLLMLRASLSDPPGRGPGGFTFLAVLFGVTILLIVATYAYLWPPREDE